MNAQVSASELFWRAIALSFRELCTEESWSPIEGLEDQLALGRITELKVHPLKERRVQPCGETQSEASRF